MATLPEEWPLVNDRPGLATPSASLANEPSADSFISLYRYDSPQLTLHDFHKFQQSPVLLASSEVDVKRLRRKPSTVNLAASAPLLTDHRHWSPSAILPRKQTHTLSQQDFVSSLPHAPVTPRPRPCTASPSLSSTVTTLQSSPTHTPIFRRVAHSERVTDGDRIELTEPIRTKRKFDTPRRAKRLPRFHGGGESGGGSSGQGELWEVYAAVFDPPLDQGAGDAVSTAAESGVVGEASEGTGLAAAQTKRAVRFEGVGRQSEASARVCSDRPSDTQSRQATSSLSLSRFEFPKPPGQDNWAGTSGHPTSSETSYSTPATILYRGASFDVVNPHASLILGTRDLETPAEIDVLLDDYFDDRISDMQYDSLTGEPSQSSLRTPSEGSRRILYDDPGSARRNILRVDEDSNSIPSPPPSAVLSDKRSPSARWVSFASANAASKTYGRGSDPFDLTLSESGSRNHLHSINNILQEERSAGLASESGAKAHGLGISDQDDGVETLATSEQSTDPTIKEIINGYDYTRVPLSSPAEADIADSPSVERGLAVSDEPSSSTSHGLLSPAQTPVTARVDSAGNFQQASNNPPSAQAAIHQALPTPPLAVYGGMRYYTGCSELPTSDQSYGETNQLLMITPEPAYIPPYTPNSPCHPATCRNPSHIHVQEQPVALSPYTVFSNRNDDAALADLAATAQRYSSMEIGQEEPELARRLQRSSSFYPEDAEADWETQCSDSNFDLHRMNARASIESYADTSLDGGSQWRLSPGPIGVAVTDDWPQRKKPAGLGFYPKIDARPQDGAAVEEKRRLDIKKQIKELEAEIVNYNMATKFSGHRTVSEAQRKADMEKLSSLRALVPSTTDRFALKVSESMSSFKEHSRMRRVNRFRPKYNPRDSFSRVARLGIQPTAMDSASDYRGLLSTPSPQMSHGELAFSDSTRTFVTVRDTPPASIRGTATKLWSPFDKDPTTRAIRPGTPLRHAPAPKEIELGPISSTKSKRVARAAMSSQYEPRQLHLLKSKRLTDAQLAAREPGWTNLPKYDTDSTLPRHGSEFSQSRPMLLKPGGDIEAALLEEQKVISKRYAYACAAFPPLALAFGLGAFDGAIKKKTSGNVTAASAKEKRNALLIFFPLGLMFWAAAIITIWIIVLVIPQTKSQSVGRNNGAPF